jgi:hypothetical protein
MDDNYFTHYLANRAEHQVRIARAAQLRLAEQVAASQPKRQIVLPVRGWISAALISTGKRMQKKIALDPTHAESIR